MRPTRGAGEVREARSAPVARAIFGTQSCAMRVNAQPCSSSMNSVCRSAAGFFGPPPFASLFGLAQQAIARSQEAARGAEPRAG